MQLLQDYSGLQIISVLCQTAQNVFRKYLNREREEETEKTCTIWPKDINTERSDWPIVLAAVPDPREAGYYHRERITSGASAIHCV